MKPGRLQAGGKQFEAALEPVNTAFPQDDGFKRVKIDFLLQPRSEYR